MANDKILRLPTLFFYRNTGYFAPVNQFDVSQAVQKHEMRSANQGVVTTLDGTNGPVIRCDGKRDKWLCAQELLYLVNHRHSETIVASRQAV
jgi:hypothetical protein